MTTGSSPQAPRILSRRTELLVLTVYCVCYGVVTTTHFLDLAHNGLALPTRGPVPGTTFPLVWAVLSKSFTLFNPLTLVLLLVRRRAGLALMAGVVLATFVMYLSLMVQWWMQAQFTRFGGFYISFVMGTFQLVTAPWMWRTAAAREAQAASGSSPAIAG